MGARVLVVVRSAPVALALVLLAGCLGGGAPGPRLAVPTDKPISVPLPPPKVPTTSWNYSDPGFVVTDPWHVGDGWDYESNQSHFRHVRVVDMRTLNATPYFIVEETRGNTGQGANDKVQMWVDGARFAIVNVTDITGGVDRYQPADPIRFWKNGTFSFNHTRFESSGRLSLNQSVVTRSYLDASRRSILFPWGYIEAKRIEQQSVTKNATGVGNPISETTVHWTDHDYLNDVQLQLPSGELYRLVAAKVGDFRRGQLAS